MAYLVRLFTQPKPVAGWFEARQGRFAAGFGCAGRIVSLYPQTVQPTLDVGQSVNASSSQPESPPATSLQLFALLLRWSQQACCATRAFLPSG